MKFIIELETRDEYDCIIWAVQASLDNKIIYLNEARERHTPGEKYADQDLRVWNHAMRLRHALIWRLGMSENDIPKVPEIS